MTTPVDDYFEGDVDLVARPSIRQLALRYGRYGYDPKKAIEKAKEVFERSHVKIGDQWFRHSGSKNLFAVGVEHYRDSILKDETPQRDALIKSLGIKADDFDPDEVGVMQLPQYPNILVPTYEGLPVASAGARMSVNEALEALEKDDEQRRLEAMDNANQTRHYGERPPFQINYR